MKLRPALNQILLGLLLAQSTVGQSADTSPDPAGEVLSSPITDPSPVFHFPADPEYVVISLDYYGGYGGSGSYADEPPPPDDLDDLVPPPPYLQLSGDGTARVHSTVGPHPGDYTLRLDYTDLTEILDFVSSTGVLHSPVRSCSEAAKDSHALGPNESFVSGHAETMVLELRAESVVGADTPEVPFRWRIVCRDLRGHAQAHPDVPWFSAVQAIERRLAKLARAVHDRGVEDEQ